MRTLTVPAVLFLSLITLSCQDTAQPLPVGSAAPGAQLMGTVRGSIANDGQDYVGRIIVITGTPTSAIYCGEPFLDVEAVIINPGGGPAIITVVGIDPMLGVQRGDRIEIQSQEFCDGLPVSNRLNLTLMPITYEP